MSRPLFRPLGASDGSGRPGLVVTVALIGGFVAAFAGCGGCSPGTEPPVGPGPTATPTGEPRKYGFYYSGQDDDLPWNRAVYVSELLGGKRSKPTTVTWFAREEPVLLAARPGTQWIAHAEEEPTPAILSILWDVHAEGTYGADDAIIIDLPPRARLRLTGNEQTDSGADTVTVADEKTGARMAAIRDTIRGQRFAVWDQNAAPESDSWRVSQEIAPPRPWVLKELRPGATFAVAARADGRCWIAMRATLTAGEDVVLDVAAQPRGGATVVCDNPRTELLLNGDLPVPPLRLNRDFYRARWAGVPEGRHALRYANGKVVPVVVDAAAAAAPPMGTDAVEITLPRDPR